MNDKRVSYNSKLKLLGKFSGEKNTLDKSSKIRESITNDSECGGVVANCKIPLMISNHDYFCDLVDVTFINLFTNLKK